MTEEARDEDDGEVVTGDGTGEGEALKSEEASLAALRFLPRKLISLTGAYWTSFTPLGITQ